VRRAIRSQGINRVDPHLSILDLGDQLSGLRTATSEAIALPL